MSWAEDARAIQAAVLMQALPAVEERLDKVDPPRTEEEQVERDAILDNIINQAITWLQQDSDQAESRIGQIQSAINAVDTQIAQINAFTFNGASVGQVNAQLNNALKPMLVSILTRQKQVAQQLQELNEARDKHGDALAWLGRYVT